MHASATLNATNCVARKQIVWGTTCLMRRVMVTPRGITRLTRDMVLRGQWEGIAMRRLSMYTVIALMTLACAKNTPVVENPTPVVAPPSVAAGSSTGMAVIPVHVTYVLRALRPALDSVFPVRDSLNSPQCIAVGGLFCHQYVYRRDSLSLRAIAGRLEIETRVQYRAQLGVLGSSRIASCGYQPEQMRRATLSMSTSLYWRRDWRIGSQKSTLSASLLDQCLVTVLGMNATRALRDLLNRQLADFAAQADTTIPSVGDFKPLADSLWRSFLEPTALDSTGSLWLLLEPQGVRVTPFAGTGPSITTDIVLYALPRVISGAKPVVRNRALPVLALGEAVREYTVPFNVELPFADVARRATALLSAETATGGVHVDSVHVTGRGDTVMVDLDVSGSMRGRLNMVSRLRWDATTRELRLDDLDWTLQSKGMLSRVKATLGAPLVGRAVRRATLGGRIPLGAQLDSVRIELMRKLNGPVAPGAVMGTSVSALEIVDVTTTATAFVVRARLAGTSGVWIQ